MAERRDSIKIRVEQKDYQVVGGSFQELLAVVRNLPDRRYLGAEKVWEIPGSLELVQGQIENSGYRLEGGAPVIENKTPPQAAAFNDRIKLEIAGYPVIVTGDSFQNMLASIKAVPGRRFDGESKQWHLPLNLSEAIAYFEKKGLQLEGLPQDAAGAPAKQTPAPNFSPAAPVPPPPPPPDMPPFPPDMDYLAEESGFDDLPDIDDFDAFFPPRESGPPVTPPMPPAAPPLTSSPKPQAAPRSSGRRDQIKVIVGNQPLLVVGGAFREMLDAIKAVPDRRFDGESKQWMLPDDIDSIQQHLQAKGFRLEER